MLWHCVVIIMRDLKIELVTKYKRGTEVKEYTYKVWAKKKSLTRSEFYAAYAAGLKPQMIFDILPEEYRLADVSVNDVVYHATKVRFEGHEYGIIRTFERNRVSMEMTVG